VNPRHVGVFLQVFRKALRGKAMTHRVLEALSSHAVPKNRSQLPERRSHLSCNLPLVADLGKKIEIEHPLSPQLLAPHQIRRARTLNPAGGLGCLTSDDRLRVR
jgi:hypothetical protein